MSLSRIYFKLDHYSRSRNAIRTAINAMAAKRVDDWIPALAHVQLGECCLKPGETKQAETELN